MSKGKKWIFRTALFLLVLSLIIGFIAGNYLYDLALNPNSDKGMVLDAPHNEIPGTEQEQEDLDRRKAEAKKRQEWFEDSGYEDKYIQSEDALKLHAFEIPAREQSNKWAIVCHGYTSEAFYMLNTAQWYHNQGFHVLLPDARGHGESEGDYIGMGWDDRLDIVQWIKGIVEAHPEAEIALYGVSMGGATVMMVSGEELPENVKVIVEDCGYSGVKEEFAYQLKQLFGYPSFPVMNFASVVTKIRAGYWLGEGSVVKQVVKSKTPTLFIHGANDTFVPAYMVEEVYNAAAVEKEKFVVEGAGHGQASDIAGDAYWDKVEEFMYRYIQR